MDDVTAGLVPPTVVREFSRSLRPWSAYSAAPLLGGETSGTDSSSSASLEDAMHPSIMVDDDVRAGEGVVGLIQVGLVDILQTYDFQKKLEHGIKSSWWKSNEISAVDPATYAARFTHRMNDVFKP